eukprot:s290_g15.t1
MEEIDFDRVESMFLPKTTQRAMVIKLSHIPHFEEKPPFLEKANNSFAIIHGTNIIGAKYSLAEALVRRADWTYCETLSKCEQPTYGCFSLGACITSCEGEIPTWHLVDLLDRASTKGKGQQEILLALQYKGAKEHLALKAGGKFRCDPLALPVAALLYQQADNFWLRKLAHGRELYLIPTGDIAAVGNAATPPPAFEPASLLVTPLTANAWLKDHPITSLAVRTYNQWLRDLNLTPAQRATVDRNLAKVEEWWNEQLDSAVDTVQRTALMMGLPVSLFKGNFNDSNLVKILTVAVTMSC